jgi:tetraacyldisaccharide 4'-kinase
MAASLQTAVTRAWRTRGLLSNALVPLAWLYGGLTALHRYAYASGIKHSRKLRVPVIVVGNVIAGGAGKTPTVLGVVAHLQSKGFRPGIISRGYGGNHTSPTVVLPESPASEVGDEPLLLQRSSGVPVVVGQDRIAAGELLLASYPDTTHILCDDGMQHYRLFRDLEICVFDTRGLGNKRLLPAGMLRQRWPRRAVAAAGQSAQHLLVLKTAPSDIPGPTASRSLATVMINGHGESLPLDTLQRANSPLHALAGIAQPENFFDMLRAAGIKLSSTEVLPDHHSFEDYERPDNPHRILICTEKDAVKLWRHRPDAWAIRLVQTLPASFLHALDNALLALETPPVSSGHGHTTH